MKELIVGIATILLPLTAQAQHVAQHVTHRHSTTCFSGGGRCGPSAPSAPQIIERGSPPADLGRLEATADAIRGEQRYQTHLMYLMLAQMQRGADLQLINTLKPTAVPLPSEVKPTEIPLPSQVKPTPIPLPADVQPVQVPLPYQVVPTQVPGPSAGGGGATGVPGAVGPAGVPPIPEPTVKRHKAWPQVARSSR